MIEPLLAQDVDEIVLGCTHYPFLEPLIEQIAQGGAARIHDPSDAVALRTAQLISEQNAVPENSRGAYAFYTSGDVESFKLVLEKLLGITNAAVCHNPP